MAEYTERVDGFQIRDTVYLGLPPKDTKPSFDIVKWVPEKEPYYGDVIRRDESGLVCVKRELITEWCYSVGFLEWNAHELSFQFRSVGLRWLEAKPSEAVVDMVLKFCEEKEKEMPDEY